MKDPLGASPCWPPCVSNLVCWIFIVLLGGHLTRKRANYAKDQSLVTSKAPQVSKQEEEGKFG